MRTRARKNTPELHLPPVRRAQGQPTTEPKVTPVELESLLRKSRELPDLRWDRVQAVRTALRSGEYDVDGRLNELLDQMSRHMGRQDGEG